MNLATPRRLLSVGALLIGPGTSLAPEWRLENDSVASDWSPLANTVTRRQLEKELASIGWTFFSMASPITTTSFGMSRPRMLDAALPRPIAAVRLERCNGLEIDDVGAIILGIPYVRISAHLRPVQKGMVFSGQ
jgi:hypothetical protein